MPNSRADYGVFFNLWDCEGRSGKSPSFGAVSRTASPGKLRRSRNRMKAESFAMITFTPPSADINIKYAYLYSFDDQLQVPHIPEQDHSMKVSGEFGCL
jgi:hypothetical protein